MSSSSLYKSALEEMTVGLDLIDLYFYLKEAVKVLRKVGCELPRSLEVMTSSVSTIIATPGRLHEDNLHTVVRFLCDFVKFAPQLEAKKRKTKQEKYLAALKSCQNEAHTYIGLILQREGLYDGAVQHLIKALWIQIRSNEPKHVIAFASHRLGLAYGMSGNRRQAASLLHKAVVSYVEAGLSRHHKHTSEAYRMFREYSEEGATSPFAARAGASSLTSIGSCRTNASDEAATGTATSAFEYERLELVRALGF